MNKGRDQGTKADSQRGQYILANWLNIGNSINNKNPYHLLRPLACQASYRRRSRSFSRPCRMYITFPVLQKKKLQFPVGVFSKTTELPPSLPLSV